MATLWRRLAAKFVDAGGLQYLLQILTNGSVMSSAAIASPLAMTFQHLCTLLSNTSHNFLCCAFVSQEYHGINVLLSFIQSHIPGIVDDYCYHIISAIRVMAIKVNCGALIQHLCLQNTCSAIFSKQSKYSRTTTALIKLLATLYDANVFLETSCASTLAETIVETRFKSQLTLKASVYHEETVKALLCIFPIPIHHSLMMSKKVIKEVMRLFRATIHNSRITSLLFALLWSLVVGFSNLRFP